jgi:hypothetical protein
MPLLSKMALYMLFSAGYASIPKSCLSALFNNAYEYSKKK